MKPPIRSRALALLASAGALAAIAPSVEAAISQPDVSYDLGSPPAPSPATQNALDVHRPDGSSTTDSRPVVVYVHGGGWRVGDKDNQIIDKVNLFTGAGYVFVSLNYRLSPNPIDPAYPPGRVRFPDHPDDVGEAIGWLDRNIAAYGGDPNRLLLIGHSAGAHLVSLVSTDFGYVERYGVEPWQLTGTVSLDSDAYDVAERISELPPGSGGEAGYFNAFGTPAENAAEGTWAAGSPINWVDGKDPEPQFLFVTQGRSQQRIADSERMAVALGQDPAASVLRPPYGHEEISDAVGSADDPAGETAAIMDFFDRRIDDAVAPKVQITDRPSKTIRTKKAHARVRFRFGSSVKGSAFECRLDREKLRPCRSPRTYRLERGRYRFEVKALAPSGRPGKSKTARFRVIRPQAR